jgi:methylated-DNA-[protein]-cysteine S-methyltransferase
MTPDADLEARLRAELPDEPPPRLAAAADRAGLVDVAVATTESPLGPLLLAATRAGLARLAYLAVRDEADVLDELARDLGPRVLVAPGRLASAVTQLEEYFAGRRRRFDLPVDLARLGPFTRAVLEVTAAIPPGEVRNYREIAHAAGSPRGARAAGNALGTNPVPIVVPCHRVVRTGGGLGGYTGGLGIKRRLLELEGAPLAG